MPTETQAPAMGDGRVSSAGLQSFGQLGSYLLLAKLGQGGMAVVYLALHKNDASAGYRRLVVLKVLHERLGEDAQFVQMFVKEANLASKLVHPNIVRTFGAVNEGGRLCIVMEYLDGVPLSAILKRAGHLDFEARIALVNAIVGALNGLHFVHHFCDDDGAPLKLVHRDIKPGNIFVTFDGQVKVLDFGIAKVTATDLTASQMIKGTVQYMAPESLEFSRSVDAKTDIFSAGMMLWEVVRGQRLWGNQAVPVIVQGLLAGRLPDMDASEVPREWIEICQKATSVSADERYPDANAMRDAILRALQHQHRRVSLIDVVASLCGTVRAQRAAVVERRVEDAIGFVYQQTTPRDSMASGLEWSPTLSNESIVTSAPVVEELSDRSRIVIAVAVAIITLMVCSLLYYLFMVD